MLPLMFTDDTNFYIKTLLQKFNTYCKLKYKG